jgi:hypothetical protein
MRTRLLVVASRTADAPELLARLEARAERGPLAVTLLTPATRSERESALSRADAAVAHLRERGIEAESVVGEGDPIVAVQEIWDPCRYDEVVVSTLPTGTSRWLQVDLPHRIARLTDATVHHVEVTPAPPPARPTPPPTRLRQPLLIGVLAQLRTGTRPSARS